MWSCLCGGSTSTASPPREAEWHSGARSRDPAARPDPCSENHTPYVMHQCAGRATPLDEWDVLGLLPPKMEQAYACPAWEHCAGWPMVDAC